MNIETFLKKLEGVRKQGQGYMALCPSHEDQNPSLSIGVGRDGEILVKCFAGCRIEQILDVLDLTLADLFQATWGRGGSSPSGEHATLQQPAGCTLEQYANAKRLPLDFLIGLGATQIWIQRTPAISFPYHNVNGEIVAVRFRIALAGSGNRSSRFRWRKGSKPSLYGLGQLRKPEYVVLVEGESDAQTLWLHDIPALGIPGAANWREDRDALILDGISKIYVVIENDKGGQTLLASLAKSRIRERAFWVRLENAKDPSEMYLADPQNFICNFEKALSTAISWTEEQKMAADGELQTAWARCAEIAQSPNILAKVVSRLAESGVAGEERVIKLLYLVVTSRLLKRPVSAAIKAPSSAGKSYLLERVLELFPDSAHKTVSGMSEKVLAHFEEPLAYRMLVIIEAAGLQGEFGSYLLRSLLSENQIRYLTLEQGSDGNWHPREIIIEGPTGLITTTTAISLHPENETRYLSIPISDSPEQTKDIMLAQAEDSSVVPDNTPLRAFQEWLAGSERRVVIPFAKELAALIPPVAVRLRRDFPTILSLIKTHAILHQFNRDKDKDGRIIATIEGDFTAVRDLIHDLLADTLESAISPAISETVAAVGRLACNGSEPSVSDVARALNLDRSSALRRVRAALSKEYLKNSETKRGKPLRLSLGDPLPDKVQILPDHESLKRCCAVAQRLEGATPPPSPKQTAPGPDANIDSNDEFEEGLL